MQEQHEICQVWTLSVEEEVGSMHVKVFPWKIQSNCRYPKAKRLSPTQTKCCQSRCRNVPTNASAISGLEQLAKLSCGKSCLTWDDLQTSQNGLTKCRDSGKEMEQRVGEWDAKIQSLEKDLADAQMACISKTTEYDELKGAWTLATVTDQRFA
jgi:hypothetical protein